MPQQPEDRVFVRSRKHYRARYSAGEVKLGGVVLAGLLAVAGWVAWRGAHPDPALLAPPPPLPRRAPERVERGPMPEEVAPSGWSEQKLAVFGPADLYVKIDGREGYYKGLGFRRLHCLTLSAPGGDPTIDLELYDLGQAVNALGAASGELPPGAAPQLLDGSLALLDRNALYLTRGRLYLRAIGSAEGEAVRGALARIRDRFLAALPGEPLPWSYALFAGLGVPPAQISYLAENAFSFGFASGVHVGRLPDGETELFVAPVADRARARALAGRFARGFAEYGEPLGRRSGAAWFRDRYQARASAAVAAGRLVVGVRGAADAAAGAALLERLRGAVLALPRATDFAAGAAAKEE